MNLSDLILSGIALNKGDLAVSRFDTDGSGNVNYAGFAKRGALSSEAKWSIFKYTYTGSDVTLITSSGNGQIWDNRASLTYA